MIATRAGANAIATIGRRQFALAAPLRRSGVARPQSTIGARSATLKGSATRMSTRGSGKGRARAGKDGKGPPAGLGAEPEAVPEPPLSAEALRQQQEVSVETKRKNWFVGFFLMAFAGGTYYYTIHMMGSQDSLGDVEKEAEEEEMIHLHKSKLKYGNPRDPSVLEPVVGGFKEGAENAKTKAQNLKGKAVDAKNDAKNAVQDMKDEATDKMQAAVDYAAQGKERLLIVDGAVVVPESTDEKKGKGWRKYWLFGPRVGEDDE